MFAASCWVLQDKKINREEWVGKVGVSSVMPPGEEFSDMLNIFFRGVVYPQVLWQQSEAPPTEC